MGPAIRSPIDPAMTMRPGAGPQRGQHRLGHRELPDQVHLQLLAQRRDRQELQRAGERHARVVDQTAQRAVGGDLFTRGRRRVGVGDVEPQHPHPPAVLAGQPLRCGRDAHARPTLGTHR
jgi:hypothetical protein